MWMFAVVVVQAQSISNPGFDATAPLSIPNTGTVDGWTFEGGGM